jgi:thioredoxin-related protein
MNKLHTSRYLVLALGSLIVAGLATAGEPSKAEPGTGAESLEWVEYGVALEQAAREDKHIVIDFYTNWCGWCKVMDRKTYTDARVMQLLNESFVIAKINAESNKRFSVGDRQMTGREIAQQYRVQSFPMTWFLKPDGSPLASIPGYIEADKFTRALEYVHGRNYENEESE